MLRAVGKSLIRLVPVLILVTFFTSALVEMLPGDPAVVILGQERATPEAVAQVRADLHLDDNFFLRYVKWLGDVVTGDLGQSPRDKFAGTSVWDLITLKLPITLELAVVALLLALAISVPIGMYTAYRARSPLDRISNQISFGLISIPQFLMAIILVYVFFNKLDWLPPQGWIRLTEWQWSEHIKRLTMPVLSLALVEVAIFQRLLRSDMMSTLQEDYVLAAKAKGMPSWHILLRHALRPSSFSLITLAGVSLGRLIGGTVIIESFFALGGLGQALADAILQRDIVILQGMVLFIASVYVLLNLLVELGYAVLDPRVRR